MIPTNEMTINFELMISIITTSNPLFAKREEVKGFIIPLKRKFHFDVGVNPWQIQIVGTDYLLRAQDDSILLTNFLACSSVRNIITFHDPSRPKLGMKPL